ncbi:MAG: hypothetical protein Kow0031_06970 [Anaerolineae bacterium]
MFLSVRSKHQFLSDRLLVEDNLERRWEEYAASKGGKPESQTVCEADDSIAVDALVGIAGDYDAFVGSDGKHGLEEWLQTQDNELWLSSEPQPFMDTAENFWYSVAEFNIA